MKKLFIFFLLLFSFPCGAQNLIDAKKLNISAFLTIGTPIFSTIKRQSLFCFFHAVKIQRRIYPPRRCFLIVSHRPNEQLYDVLTFVAGYTYLPRSEVQFRAGNLKAALFTSEDTAWAKNLKTDAEIAKAMNKAVRVTVKGLTIEGIETYDTFP